MEPGAARSGTAGTRPRAAVAQRVGVQSHGRALRGRSAGAAIYALELGEQAAGGKAAPPTSPAIDQKIAALLGTDAAAIAITDLVIHPKTHNAYISVMRGTGADAKPALLRVDGDGKIEPSRSTTSSYTRVALSNRAGRRRRAAATARRRGHRHGVRRRPADRRRAVERGVRVEAAVDRRIRSSRPIRGTSVEIFHGNHGQLETRVAGLHVHALHDRQQAVPDRELHLHAAGAVLDGQPEGLEGRRARRSRSSAPATGRST